MFFSSRASRRERRATMDPSDSRYTNIPTRRRDSIAEAGPRRTSSSLPRPSAPSDLFSPNTRSRTALQSSQTASNRVPEAGKKPETTAAPVLVESFEDASPAGRAPSKVFPDQPTPKKPLARMSKPDPWLLLDELKTLLNEGQHVLWVSYRHGRGGGCGIGECRFNGVRPERCICGLLDIDTILALHERDVMEWGQRRRSFARTHDDTLRVFGVSLREVSIYASSTRIFGGYQHDLPIVAFSCVEELFRTGIYQKGLFRDLPNRERLIQLIHIFDSGRAIGVPDGTDLSAKTRRISFGEDFSLRAESMPDVCALFSTYLSSLPEPVLCPALFDAFWLLCVRPSLVRDRAEGTDEALDENAGRCDLGAYMHASSHEHAAAGGSDEATQIRMAQVLLALLPTANFSLLVYLFSFFTQVPLSSENGIGVEDMARIFAGKVLGRPAPSRIGNANGRGGRDREDGGVARRMMVWLLRRWSQIADGLMEMGAHGPPGTPDPDRPEVPTERGSASPCDSDFPMLKREAQALAEGLRLSGPNERTPVLDDPSPGADISVRADVSAELLPSDGLFQSDATDDESMYSSAALDERLLDVPPPSSSLFLSHSPCSPLPPAPERAPATDRIQALERALADAVRETLVARAEARALARELAVLRAGGVGGVGLRRKLEIAERKWGEAWGLVRDAKELVGEV